MDRFSDCFEFYYSPFSKAEKITVLKEEKVLLKETKIFIIFKWYIFYPKKDMLFVSFIKQQIDNYPSIFVSKQVSFSLIITVLINEILV